MPAWLAKPSFFLLLSTLTIYAQENKSMNVASSPQRVEIPNSQLQKIMSAIVGQEYALYIHLPRNYGSKDQKHPVLYRVNAVVIIKQKRGHRDRGQFRHDFLDLVE
jgi:hypothetical protein